ncbi:MAG: ferric reductase-like transmembrane domain-containing protein [Desulfofustis sp.]|nr:ferric reductase-like transmembrane domain-containing protein [Desulfofustis sp.]
MAHSRPNAAAITGHDHRLTRLIIVGLLLAAAGTAGTLPFFYESTTMWYKIGLDKTLLRVGKICGLLAVTLICAQSIIGLRPRLLEKAFGAPSLLRWHRRGAAVIVLLAVLHVLLILVPEGLKNLPIGPKFWPEMLGGGLLVILVLQTGYSWTRERWRLAYQRWRTIHRYLAWCILLLVPVHLLFVSETFSQTVPRLWVVCVLGGTLAIQLTVRLRRRLTAHRR